MSEIKELLGLKCTVGNIGCYVKHADRSYGITIHTFDTDEPIFCLNFKELIETAKKWKVRGAVGAYHEAFTEITYRILNGIPVDGSIVLRNKGDRDLEYSAYDNLRSDETVRATCAYK